MSMILAACGGFLLAVLWMDLMFDVQVLRYPGQDLPEDVLASISGYYRRVTTEARPMNLLIAAVMLMTIGGCLAQGLLALAPTWLVILSLCLTAVPIGLARFRVIQNAVRLGSRADDPAGQTALARQICRDHLACFGSIFFFLVLQITYSLI